MKIFSDYFKQVLLLLTVATFLSGCGVLVGSVKPQSEKSDGYTVVPPTNSNDDWVEIPHDAQEPEDEEELSVSDLAFQSKTTASIISLNSACRRRSSHDPKSLSDLTNLLLLGITDISSKKSESLTIAETEALQTTLLGTMNNDKIKLRAVVLRYKNCIFDLMYIARPEKFSLQENVFSDFIASLKLQ